MQVTCSLGTGTDWLKHDSNYILSSCACVRMNNCLVLLIVASSLLGSIHATNGSIGAATNGLVGAATNGSMSFNVLDYGALGDGNRDDTDAFSKTWIEVCNASSSTPKLTVPQGHTFLVKPIAFEGPCMSTSIHFEIEGNIVAPNKTGEWEKCKGNTWIYFAHVGNLIVGGKGLTDGRGSIWWKNGLSNYMDKFAGISGEAIPCHRPKALSFLDCNGLQLSGLTSKNSPGSHINVAGCNNSTISDVNVIAPGDSPNTDGIDISSTTNLKILDSKIGTGDDCIAIGTDSSWINITNIICGPGHGISVGSLGMNGTQAKVEEIHVRNITFTNTQNGARIKTWQGGSGYARKITYEDIILIGVNNPIIIDQFYCFGTNCPLKPAAVAVTDVRFTSFHGTSTSEAAITFKCSQAIPCNHIAMNNIAITPSTPSNLTTFCENVHDLQAHSVIPLLNCTI